MELIDGLNPAVFAENFWGEKNQGFACLYQNMKNGHTSTRELADFIRERAVIEDTYTKSICKLAKTASNSSTSGTFAPFWQVIKTATERLAATHQKLVQKLNEVVKEIQKYGEEQHRKHKTVKGAVQGTADVVTSLQSTHDLLNKLKEAYNNRCIEFERLKKENAGAKELEKSENKYKKAMEEYKNCIEKYGKFRQDFDKKMTDSCQQFQSLEESHLRQLKEFLKQYNVALRECQNSINTVHNEFCQQCDELTEIKLIEMFAESKGTGKDKPGPIEFEECDTSNIPIPDPKEKKKKRKKPKPNKKDKNGSPGDSPDMLALSKKSATLSNCASSSLHDMYMSPSPSSTLSQQSNNIPSTSMPDVRADTPKVDEEGFTIRPEETTNENQRDSFYSDSDSDSDAEEKTRKIHVEIKPATTDGSIQNSATVDEIKKSLGNLTLSPPTLRRDKANGDVKRRIQPAMRSSTQSSGNLLDLDLTSNASGTINLFSPTNDTGSSATTPGSSDSVAALADKYAALRAFSLDDNASVMSSSTPNTITPTTTPSTSPNTTPTLTNKRWSSPFENTTDLLHSPTTTGDSLPPAIPPKQRHSLGGANTPTGMAPTTFPNPPARPPSRPMSGMQSPIPGNETPPILRQDSSSSLTSSSPFSSAIAIGTSRGPSPLTLSMSDTIPIAVAFSESVSAYFKGIDQSKCLVKITGDIMFSFPAGIIQALTSNPSPPVLAFQVKNSSHLEQIVPNKQLITNDSSQSTSESQGYYFNMSNLVMLLKNKAGKNIAASYFNVDVLKYQVKSEPDGQSTPLQLCSYWKCEPSTTEVRVDYAFNPAAMDQTVPLNNVTLLVPVDGGVTVMQSKPAATWSAESKRALWKIGDVSDAAASGSLRAKFELTEGPSKPATLAVHFSSEGTTLSGLDIDLLNTSYRLSLVKKRFSSGKYLSES